MGSSIQAAASLVKAAQEQWSLQSCTVRNVAEDNRLLVKWNEAYGNVVVEALACGVPVVAYKRGGPSEIIKHGKTGYLAQPDDKESLLKYLKVINKIDRKNCRKWVENNASSSIFASKVLSWLNTVIKGYKFLE